MSQEQRPVSAPRPRVENGGIALFLGLFVLLWAALPSATGIASTKWSVIALCAAVGWKLRRELKAALPTKKQLASFKPAAALHALRSRAARISRPGDANGSSAVPDFAPTASCTNGSQPLIEGKARTTPTPGPQTENAPDGGAVTQPRSGEGKGAGGVP